MLFTVYKLGYFNHINLGYFGKFTRELSTKNSLEAFNSNSNSNNNLNKPEEVKPAQTTLDTASENYDIKEKFFKPSKLNLHNINLTLMVTIKKLLDDQDYSEELNTLSSLAKKENISIKLDELKFYNDKYLSSKTSENNIIFPYGWGKQIIKNLILIEYKPKNSSKFKKLKHQALDILLEMQDEVLQVNLLQSK